MNVTIRQAQCFVAVAKSRSFADACQMVHLSQPALSIAVRKLEENLGGKLLQRSTRTVTLTPEGEIFYASAKKLLANWHSALEDMQNLFALRRGRLAIAVMPTFAATLLPPILTKFQSSHPSLDISVQDIVAEQVLEEVSNGGVELGITFDPGNIDAIDFYPLFLDHFVAAFPPGHSLLNKKRTSWKQLKGNRYISLQRPSSIRELVFEKLDKEGVLLTPSCEAHQLAAVGRMVSEGMGISIVPEISARQMTEMGAHCRPLYPRLSRRIGYITHRNKPKSTATIEMIKVLTNWKKEKGWLRY